MFTSLATNLGNKFGNFVGYSRRSEIQAAPLSEAASMQVTQAQAQMAALALLNDYKTSIGNTQVERSVMTSLARTADRTQWDEIESGLGLGSDLEVGTSAANMSQMLGSFGDLRGVDYGALLANAQSASLGITGSFMVAQVDQQTQLSALLSTFERSNVDKTGVGGGFEPVSGSVLGSVFDADFALDRAQAMFDELTKELGERAPRTDKEEFFLNGASMDFANEPIGSLAREQNREMPVDPLDELTMQDARESNRDMTFRMDGTSEVTECTGEKGEVSGAAAEFDFAAMAASLQTSLLQSATLSTSDGSLVKRASREAAAWDSLNTSRALSETLGNKPVGISEREHNREHLDDAIFQFQASAGLGVRPRQAPQAVS